MKIKRKFNKHLLDKAKNTNSIRVLYKKVGRVPEVKVINNILKLKKAIIQKNLDIIPYETVYIICHNQQLMKYKKSNIFLSLKRIAGDFILIDIDRTKREFKSLSQENIIWYTKDLINKSPMPTSKKINMPKINSIKNIYERGFEDTRTTKSNYFETTLLNILTNLELSLTSILKNNGDDKK